MFTVVLTGDVLQGVDTPIRLSKPGLIGLFVSITSGLTESRRIEILG
jgi:hypothetical protein